MGLGRNEKTPNDTAEPPLQTGREAQHVASGRLDDSYSMVPLEEDVTYAEARGYEQAYTEYYGTRDTSRIGKPIEPGDANRQWSWDPSRDDPVQMSFENTISKRRLN